MFESGEVELDRTTRGSAVACILDLDAHRDHFARDRRLNVGVRLPAAAIADGYAGCRVLYGKSIAVRAPRPRSSIRSFM